MKYREFIQDYFLIDEPKSGKLVPFIFRDVQNKYYEELVRDYDIEKNGLQNAVREIILKARKEGFTSLVLAMFAADDIISQNPTETLVISYKDDATQTFRKRYRNFVLSYAAKKLGYSVDQIQREPQILKEVAKTFLAVDSTEFELAHNRAHFYCGTASARVGGRGGTVQKLLFSEAAFYPDKKEMRAKEIIEGTANQMDKEAGWIFVESTANGDMNHYSKMWQLAESKQSRYRGRFYGWREMYTEQQFEIICSEFTDKRMIPQEYPETPAEAFLASGDRFFDPAISSNLRVDTPVVMGKWNYFAEYKPGHRYILGADVSEGVKRHNSTIIVIDMDAPLNVDGRMIQKPKVVASYASNEIPPDLFAYEIKNGGLRFGNCMAVVERNNHGFATLTVLKEIYFNIYKDENEKLGWHTNLASKPKMMHDIRTAIHENLLEVSDAALKQEIVSFPSTDLNSANVDEEDETVGHYDRTIALAIAWQLRSYAMPGTMGTVDDPDIRRSQDNFDKYASFNEL
jgi:hypothetical protein